MSDVLTRRRLLSALAAAGAGGIAGCGGGGGQAVGPTTSDPPTLTATPSYDGWVGDVPTYDRLDADRITVYTGVQGNGGYFAYEPVAVAITPGTEVVWRWTGRGGVHNVVGLDRDFRSELVGEEGHTYSYTFQEPGVVKYYCGPHRSRGMRGIILVREA
ncbi:MAG: halocyanin domain-containing protein [Halodesulfurarchaeum sp.]